MLGATISSVQRYSQEATKALLQSNQVWAQVNSNSGGTKCAKREFVPFWWLSSKHHTVTEFSYTSRSQLSFSIPDRLWDTVGTLGYNLGSVGSWVPEHRFYWARFHDPVGLSVPSDANSTQSVIYNDCFATVPSHTLFARLSAQHPLQSITGPTNGQSRYTISVSCPVIILATPNLWNYYHWLAEGVSTILLAREFVIPKIEQEIRDHDWRDPGSKKPCTVKFMLPRARTLKSFAFDALKLLNISSDQWIHHDPEIGKQYVCYPTLDHSFLVPVIDPCVVRSWLSPFSSCCQL